MNHTTDHTSEPKTFNKTLGICAIVLLAALAAIFIFKVSVSSVLFVGVALACPLMHIWMMRDGGHKH